jgi:alkylation response protein AidB-like acyl-CoA dehydrogenase
VRAEVRAFLSEHPWDDRPEQRALSWTRFDEPFSRALGARGLIGLTIPKTYGGRGLSQLERYVVSEELLAHGAPVAAHWIADRQCAPLLLRFGSESLKHRFLPVIARGEAYFCIGMSEPNVGSDLAALETKACPVSGGYLVQGTKLWSTHATRCQHMVALARTANSADKREGLSQLLIDLDTPGIQVRAIRDMAGHRHFAEVTFEDAFVPSERLIGREGEGFRQAMAELALERSGPERYLSGFVLIEALVTALSSSRDALAPKSLGELGSRLATLRQMSLSVAARLERGEDVSFEAALVKDLGTSFEQTLPDSVHELLATMPLREGGDALMRVHGIVSLLAPSFSLRGGTREILRNLIAKELLR